MSIVIPTDLTTFDDAAMDDSGMGISVEERKKIPAEDYGDPKNRKFPIRDQHDLDSAAHLIGKAAPGVKARIIAIAKRKDLKLPQAWQTEVKNDDGNDNADNSEFSIDEVLNFSEDYVIRRGKIFEAGEYKDKGITVTPDDLKQMVTDFQAAPVDMEHMSTPLDGKLGHWTKAELSVDGKSVLGEVSIPKWLNELFPDKALRVSATIDKIAKKFVGLALVNQPRVTDAAIMKAYAAFAGKRNSQQDQEAIQAIHDVSCPMCAMSAQYKSIHDNSRALGAFCAKFDNDSDMSANKKDNSEPGFTSVPAVNPTHLTYNNNPKGVTPMSTTPTTPETPDVAVFEGKLQEMQARLDAAEKREAEMRARLRHEEAVKFADSEVTANRAYPAERDAMIALFTQAAIDDDSDAKPSALATFGAAKVQANRVQALKALYAGRLPYTNLTTEEVKITENNEVVFANRTQTKEEKIDPARLERLKGLTPLGQSAIRR